MPGEVRAKMEPRFGRDFSGVRIHRDAEAASTARALGARAYTLGDHVAFNSGEYSPGTASGDHLMAHELTHVAQARDDVVRRQYEDEAQAPSIESDPAVSEEERFRSQLRVELADEIDALRRSDNCDTRTYGQRAGLLLLFGSEPLPDNEAGVEAYREWLFVTADEEESTLDVLPGMALDASPEAFPVTWATLFGQLLFFDHSVVQDYFVATAEAYSTLLTMSAELPEEIWEVGLPVPFERARGIRRFYLSTSHAALEYANPAREFAAAGLVYTRALWRYAFYARWNRSAEVLVEAIRNCSLAPDVAAYNDFRENFADAFAALPERLGAAESEEELTEVESAALEIQNAIFAVGILSGLEALLGILAGWSNAQDLFDAGVAGADVEVAGAADIDKFLHALTWASDHGYFGDAAEHILDALLENGVEILAKTLGIIAAGVAVQFVPGLNVAFDVALFLYGGLDLIEAIDSIATAIDRVFSATTTLQLQRASAELALVLLADGATSLVDIILFMVSLRGVKGRAREISRRTPDITNEEALRRALREADDEASRAIMRAGEYDTWKASLNSETRALLNADEGLSRLYQSMDPRVRSIFTHCASICIPTNVTRAQISVVVRFVDFVGEVAMGRLKILFHVQRNNIGRAVNDLQRVRDIDGLDALLQRTLAREANPPTAPILTQGAATAARNSTGTAVGGTRLPRILDGEGWLLQTEGNAGLIPRQIVDRLRNRSYGSFSEMQADFWREVARDDVLSSGFNRRNRILMSRGEAPFAPSALQYGGASGGRYTLHHIRPIEHGGGVYDMDNLLIVSPRLHAGAIHAPTRRLPRFRQMPLE